MAMMQKMTSINDSRFGRILALNAERKSMVPVRNSRGRISLMMRRTGWVWRPVTLSRTLRVPEGNPTLHFEVAASPGGDFRLVVRVDGCALLKTDVAAARGDELRLVPFDLSLEPWAGKTVAIELLNEPTGWLNEAALWRDIRITANTGL